MLVLGRPTLRSMVIGIPLVVAGEAIRLWASGYLIKLDELTTAGPFALCRNPLYAGSFITSVGYFAMCNRLDIWIVGIVLFWLFHGGAIAFEEKLLRQKFGQDYENYLAAVPRFIPRPGPLSGNGSFSFAQLLCNREYRGVIGAVLMIVMLFIKAGTGALLPVGWLASMRP